MRSQWSQRPLRADLVYSPTAGQVFDYPDSLNALVQLAREKLQRHDDARSFVRGLFGTTINLRPDPKTKQLVVELHGQTNPAHDHVVEHLCRELNETETLYPGTDLTLFFRPLRSSLFHAGQDV